MNDTQLKSLIKVVEYGSFYKAEGSLYLSRQAIRKQINSLEEELGFPLLIRARQGVSLTLAGEEFYIRAKKLLEDIEATIQKCGELSQKEPTIRIANPYHPHPLLENAIVEFARRFPHIKQHVIMELKPQKPHTAVIVDDVLSGRADLAEYLYESDLEDYNIQYTKLTPLPPKCIVASSHPLANHKIIKLEDLSGRRIAMPWKYAKLLSQMDERCRDFSLEILKGNIVQDIANVCYNGGIFISYAHFLNSAPPLITIPLESDIVSMSVIVYRKPPSPIVRDFLSVVDDLYPTVDSKHSVDSKNVECRR